MSILYMVLPEDDLSNEEEFDLVKDNYKVFTHEDAIYIVSKDQDVNRDLKANVQWTMLVGIGDFRVFGEENAYHQTKCQGLPKKIKKFLNIV